MIEGKELTKIAAAPNYRLARKVEWKRNNLRVVRKQNANKKGGDDEGVPITTFPTGIANDPIIINGIKEEEDDKVGQS